MAQPSMWMELLILIQGCIALEELWLMAPDVAGMAAIAGLGEELAGRMKKRQV